MLKRSLRWIGRIFLLLVIIDVGYLIGIWPDWDRYKTGPVRGSSFISNYELEQRGHPDWPELRWNLINLAILSFPAAALVVLLRELLRIGVALCLGFGLFGVQWGVGPSLFRFRWGDLH